MTLNLCFLPDAQVANGFNSIESKPDTDEKFYELFKYSGIKKSPEIEQLVTQRHFAIHEGDIGKSTKDKWRFYFKLDHILRDIILNRIGYDGVRKRQIDFLQDNNKVEV